MEKETEKILKFQLNSPVHYCWSGTFIGKNQNWKHMERVLSDYELIVMEKGCLYIEDEWQQYVVREGEYLLMEPTKCQRGFQNSKCKFYWMHFTLDSSEGEGDSTHLEAGISQGVQPSASTIVSVPKHGKLFSSERLYILLKQLQDTDLRYLDNSYNSYLATSILFELVHQTDSVRQEEKDLVAMVSDYVVEHISEKLPVKEIASAFGYNEKYFSTAFHKKAGIGVKQYVDHKKMERAKYLLLNTNAWVIEIAEILGYENVQNFYHIFKKETNTTPSEYRRIYGKKNEFDR